MEEEVGNSEPQKEGITFKSHQLTPVKRLIGHTDWIYEFVIVPFFDGKCRIISCSDDKTLRIFTEEGKCEETFTHTSKLNSIIFLPSTSHILCTDWNGELLFLHLTTEKLALFSVFKKRLKVAGKIKICDASSTLWRLAQLSPLSFLCCVVSGRSKGSLYKMTFKEFKENKIHYDSTKKLFSSNEGIRCIFQLQQHPQVVMFAGGDKKEKRLHQNKGQDYTIKKMDWKEEKLVMKFPLYHQDAILSIVSYIDQKKMEEIIVSSSRDKRLIFWSLEGQKMKEILCSDPVSCILSKDNMKLLFSMYGSVYKFGEIVSFDLIEEKICGRRNVHKDFISSMKWINQTMFVTSSNDRTLCINRFDEKCFVLKK